jgi:REP element-mobilizing transposase RayT
VKQTNFLKREEKAHGGELRKTRKGRSGARSLSTRETMHLVLRSTKAKDEWSFKRHQQKIQVIFEKFSNKYGVKLLTAANVGNHLHLQIKLSNRHLYRPFIRAVTSAIAIAVTGTNRWKPKKVKFWDYRPFTRIIKSYRASLTLRDYIFINQLEGYGVARIVARNFVLNSS